MVDALRETMAAGIGEPARRLAAGQRWVAGRSRCASYIRLLGLIAGLLLSSQAQAAPPDSQEAGALGARERAQVASAETRTVGFILLGAAGVLGVGLIVGFIVVQRRRRARLFDFEKVHFDDEHFTDRLNAEHILGPPRSIIRQEAPPPPARTALDGALVFKEAQSAEPMEGLDELLERVRGLRSRLQDIQGGAPEDALAGPALRGGRRGAQGEAAQQLERMVCSGCDRRYELDVTYCYHDGLPLMRDTLRMAHRAELVWACKSCGWESNAPEAGPAPRCPHAEHEAVALDASENAPLVPMIPMMVCPSCGGFGAPGQVTCEVDDTGLIPLLDLRSPVLPRHGFGPRRMICVECGARHGSAARFCSQDGTRLVALN